MLTLWSELTFISWNLQHGEQRILFFPFECPSRLPEEREVERGEEIQEIQAEEAEQQREWSSMPVKIRLNGAISHLQPSDLPQKSCVSAPQSLYLLRCLTWWLIIPTYMLFSGTVGLKHVWEDETRTLSGVQDVERWSLRWKFSVVSLLSSCHRWCLYDAICRLSLELPLEEKLCVDA